MSFYKWSKKLLVRNEFLTDEEKKRGVTKKFAVAEACCCPQWYCVLTAGGDYECRDTSPPPDENAQVLSEHKDETACQKECYERYYCVNVNNDYQCKKEGDVKEDDDIVGGPYPEDECETECVNCPPCGNDACEAEAAGDTDIIAQCCASLTDDEEWTYDEDAAEWTITRYCGDNKNTPCRGDDAAGFPDSPQDGDTVNFPCVPNGKVPDDLPDCKKCLFDCDKDAQPPECIPAPDTGQYAKKECEKECAGLWYCTSTTECERQNPPKNPAKKGFETEDECVAAAPVDCAMPPVRYICATRVDACTQFPLNYGQWQYNSFGQWVIRRSRCAGQFPADTCTIADPPSRPGAFPGEIVNVGCKAVAPNTTKECITEEEFNKGGWVNVSGPHDTIEQCEASCNPPPPPCGDCVPIPGITSLKLEVKDEQVCVLATAQWTPPEGCYESDQEARDKVSIEFEFLDKDRQVVQRIGGPANIGDNTVGYCNSVADACGPFSKKAEFVRAKAVSDECESKWSREFGLPGGSASWEDICKPPQPDGYICQGPFSQIWECAPCNECAGQPEVYATMEECQAACKPPQPVSLDCWYCSSPGQDNAAVGQQNYAGDPQRGIPAPNAGESCPDYDARVKALGIPGWGDNFTLHDTEPEAMSKCFPTPPPDPCPPNATCTWSPPDCGDGECWLDAVWDDSDPLPPAYCAPRPYDCTSKAACEAWLQANPNPPCVGRQGDNPLP
jgi:hypothetical protein